MVYSYIFYSVVTVIVLGICVIAERSKSSIGPITLTVFLSLIVGLRSYTVGSDTMSYVDIFRLISNGGTYEKDPGFNYVCKFLLLFSENPTFLFLVFALLTYSLVIFRLWELRGKCSFTLSFLTFYSLFFFQSMNGVRQLVAVAIVFYATRFLFKRNYYLYVALVLLAATLFHLSAVLGFVLIGPELFFWKELKKKEKTALVVILVLAVSFVVFLFPRVPGYLDSYRHYFDTVKKAFGLRVFALLAFLGIFVLFSRESDYSFSSTRRERKSFFLRVAIYYFLGCVLGGVGYYYPFMERLGWHFMPYHGVLFGSAVKNRRPFKRLVFFSMSLAIAGFVLFQYLFLLNGSNHHPYSFIWE